MPSLSISHEPPGYECPFCLLAAGGETRLSQQRHIVARTPDTLTVVNPRFWPNNPGSLIVVPVGHHENLYVLPDEVGAAVHRAVREAACALRLAYECEGTSTRQHNEPAGYQDVWHYHVHVFPRYPDDNLCGSGPGGYQDHAAMANYAARVRAAYRRP
jgi:histidine triad (HIT) family protein